MINNTHKTTLPPTVELVVICLLLISLAFVVTQVRKESAKEATKTQCLATLESLSLQGKYIRGTNSCYVKVTDGAKEGALIRLDTYLANRYLR